MTPSQTMVAYFLSAMTSWYPPAKTWYPSPMVKKHPDVLEDPEEMRNRFESIAIDLTKVVYDKNYIPFHAGVDARGKDAMYALGIASYESGGFRKDVDAGYLVADYGQSPCIMAVWMPPNMGGLTTTKEGWTLEDVRQDRVKCFITGLDRLRFSWRMCAGYNVLDRLSGYTIGHCEHNEVKSRTRAARAYLWLNAHPVPANDQDVLAEFAGAQ